MFIDRSINAVRARDRIVFNKEKTGYTNSISLVYSEIYRRESTHTYIHS